MTHNEWTGKWLGKRIDFDKVYGAQCADVAGQYALDVHGITGLEGVTGAVDFFTKHDSRPKQKAAYYAIKYQEGLEPPQGAFIVWGATPNNSYGHIAVCDSSTQTSLTVLEQDGFNNPSRDVSKGDAYGLKRRTATYNNVLGWLVPKQKPNGNLPPANAKIAASDRGAQNGDYWFNQSANSWMQLADSKWRFI
ncbi:MAG: CHAP domain-containing protein [Treponema sp.]|nr:CHAP domain-containing protein [Treponema sp.]